MNIVTIDDYNSKELDIYARLNEAQLLHYNEPDLGIFIAESPLVIERALKAGYEPISALVSREDVGKTLSIIGDCPVYVAPEEELSKITGFKLTRGMLCAMKRKQYPSLVDVCKNAKRVALLEDVVNPTNVGAIFRSAAALNMDAVILTKSCADPLYRRSARVAMGTVFQIPWTYIDCEDLAEDGFLQFRELGFKTVSMALKENSYSIDDEALAKEEKLVILLGTEGMGLKDKTIAASDYTVMIPMSHGVDSLNVAAASAVAFWELGKSGAKK